MFSGNDIHSAGTAIFQLAIETAPLPSAAINPVVSPALPPSFVRPRLAQSVQGDNRNGARRIYGIGSRKVQTIVPGGKENQRAFEWALLPGDAVFPMCLPLNAAGDLPQVCVLTGAREHAPSTAPGTAKALRFSKCDFYEVELNGDYISAEATFWGVADEPQSAPSLASIAPDLTLAPFQWKDVQEIRVLGVEVRSVATRVTLRGEYGLKRDNYRPWSGNDPWSGTPYVIREGNFSHSVAMQFLVPDALQSINAAQSTTADALYIRIQNPDGKRLLVRAPGALYDADSRESRAEGLSSRLSFFVTDLLFEFGNANT